MEKDQQQAPALIQVFASVLAAMIGVQSEKNRERDFSKGKFSQFVIVGLVLGTLFVLLIWLTVKIVMHFAGV